MLLYKEAFKIAYQLKTFDIDFGMLSAVAAGGTSLGPIFEKLGYIQALERSGVSIYTAKGFSVDFLVQRPGAKEAGAIDVPQWGIKARPIPYINILLDFTLIANIEDFKVRAPTPEAYFVHKMIVAQRRTAPGKKEKDLEQCSIIADRLDEQRFDDIVRSLSIGRSTRKNLGLSCEAIGFPPERFKL